TRHGSSAVPRRQGADAVERTSSAGISAFFIDVTSWHASLQRPGPPGRVTRLWVLLKLLAEFTCAIHRFAWAEVVQLEELADLDFAFLAVGSRGALGPLDSLLPRLHLDDPVSGDEFLGLGKGAVNHRGPASRELDTGALGGGLETGEIEEHTGFHQLLVVFAHRGKNLLARHDARFRLLVGLDDHHETHG